MKALSHNSHRLTQTLSLLLLSCSSLTAIADTDGRFSIGLHSGLGQHNPDANTLDNKSHSWSVSTGYRVSPHISLEAEYADLGTTIVTNDDSAAAIDSQEANVSVLWYGYRQLESSTQPQGNGFSLYGRFGSSQLRQKSQNTEDTETSSHMLFGAGSEFEWDNGISARAELNMRDDVFHQLQFGLLKRFGANNNDHEQVMASRHLSVPAPQDDALWENRLSLNLPTLVFGNKAKLNKEQRKVLKLLASQLQRHQGLRLIVNGHSDSEGTMKERLQRGREQAINVGRFLQKQGVSGKRLNIRTYGDQSPYRRHNGEILDTYNRRVEFEINPQ